MLVVLVSREEWGLGKLSMVVELPVTMYPCREIEEERYCEKKSVLYKNTVKTVWELSPGYQPLGNYNSRVSDRKINV